MLFHIVNPNNSLIPNVVMKSSVFLHPLVSIIFLSLSDSLLKPVPFQAHHGCMRLWWEEHCLGTLSSQTTGDGCPAGSDQNPKMPHVPSTGDGPGVAAQQPAQAGQAQI